MTTYFPLFFVNFESFDYLNLKCLEAISFHFSIFYKLINAIPEIIIDN